jgi:hypothetical protein
MMSARLKFGSAFGPANSMVPPICKPRDIGLKQNPPSA